jgi:hypothetical protein
LTSTPIAVKIECSNFTPTQPPIPDEHDFVVVTDGNIILGEDASFGRWSWFFEVLFAFAVTAVNAPSATHLVRVVMKAHLKRLYCELPRGS